LADGIDFYLLHARPQPAHIKPEMIPVHSQAKHQINTKMTKYFTTAPL
jgi:hypothetical protein